MKYEIPGSPEFMNDLIVYEIPTKSYTSPNGPESGNFQSLAEKMEYLNEIGINSIWLSGHQLCDSKHFYNIWTEYACIDPSQLDPTLGTEADFKYMIDTAHKYGIRVFLDVITHGVMSYSPLVKQYPEWFKDGSWGMTDFDWYGHHTDLDDWWVNTWVNYVVNFGIDGYRLDVAYYRSDLWSAVRKKAKEAGHEIMIMLEGGVSENGVSDVLQCGIGISANQGISANNRMLWDAAGYILDKRNYELEQYTFEVNYVDGTKQISSRVMEESYPDMELLHAIFLEPEIRQVDCNNYQTAYEEEMAVVRLEGVNPLKIIENIVIKNQNCAVWQTKEKRESCVDYHAEYEKDGITAIVKFPFHQQKGQYISIQLSCHDNGWEGYPADKSPYAARGSRCIMGYSCMLTPGIPVMMAGEEFNADFTPLPNLAPKLFGGGEPGTGKWLYGSWIQWEQLKNQEKQDMLSDTKELVAIRKQFKELIKPFKIKELSDVNLYRVECESHATIPVPYIYVKDEKALLVAGNLNAENQNVKFKLPEELKNEKLKVEVVFGNQEKHIFSSEEFEQHGWMIGGDKKKHGGLIVIYIEKECQV